MSRDANLTPGTLYIVPTPIGNLGDLSPRAAAVLAAVDVLACEDTRTTRRLLAALDIDARAHMMSCHAHNEASRAQEIVHRLRSGQTVALVSDAGTPTCSDPGSRVVASVAAADLPVVPIPGPVAWVTALSASALPTDAVLFVGFLPHKTGPRRDRLQALAPRTATLALYLSPHRALDVLHDALDLLGDRPACLARELTKRYEELLRAPLSTLIDTLQSRDALRGELVLLIHGHDPDLDTPDLDDARRLATLLADDNVHPRTIKSVVAEMYGISKREAYDLIPHD